MKAGAANRVEVAAEFGTISEIRRALLARRISPAELVRSVLARIEQEDPVLRAWVHIDADAAIAAALSVDITSGPLAGVPFGVKDVIDVRGMPTGHGVDSPSAVPVLADAWCVAAVRAAGGIPVGKLATTPLAFRDPPAPTRNPWDLVRTPGGSSAGSAASVGARQIPFAFGTQTGGSTLRPAAYNGVVGLITSLGKISTVGMSPLAPTLDRVGILCRTARDATTLLGVYDPSAFHAAAPAPLRIGYARAFQNSVIDRQAQGVIDDAIEKLAGAEVNELSMPQILTEGVLHWETILAFEAARLLPESLIKSSSSPSLAATLQRGSSIHHSVYCNALLFRSRAQAAFAKLFERCDVIAHAAAGSPPERSNTGFAQLALSWPPTALGLPALSLPVGLTAEGWPVGLQLVGRFGDDGSLLAAARSIEAMINFSSPGPVALRSTVTSRVN